MSTKVQHRGRVTTARPVVLQQGPKWGASVAIAWLHPGHVDGSFMDSVVGLLMAEAGAPDEFRHVCQPHGGQIAMQSSPRIAEARSQVVDAFLNSPVYEHTEWLWMVDSDMTFEADALHRLVEAADPKLRPIIGGLCFAGGRSSKMYPTLYRVLDTDGQMESIDEYPADAVVKVDATGAACLLVHKQVFRAMAARFATHADGRPNAYPWFVEGLCGPKGQPYGEDIAFCLRAGQLDIPIHVHTGVKLGHMKQIELTEDLYLAGRSTTDDA